MSTSLYRLYSKGNVLLYVGISNGALRRLDNEHRRRKWWWERVSAIRVEHFEDRDEAARAEAKAIKNERPQYNVMHAPKRSPRTQPPKARKAAKKQGWHNARKTHCPQGHPLEGDNVYWHDGKRHCKMCRKARSGKKPPDGSVAKSGEPQLLNDHQDCIAGVAKGCATVAKTPS